MKTAIIIKGNPKFVVDSSDADKFYSDLKSFLESLDFSVIFDSGKPYTVPAPADLWIGHSWGSSRLKYALEGTKTIALGTQGGINNPDDDALSPGQIPNKNHYILTEDMKNKIKSALA